MLAEGVLLVMVDQYPSRRCQGAREKLCQEDELVERSG